MPFDAIESTTKLNIFVIGCHEGAIPRFRGHARRAASTPFLAVRSDRGSPMLVNNPHRPGPAASHAG
jgi:hypothetical protein